MIPTHQSFDVQDLACDQVELRLVVQDELAAFDGFSQFLYEMHLITIFVEVLVVACKRGAAQLGSVHCYVGAPDQSGTIRRIVRCHGYSDTGSDVRGDYIKCKGLVQASRQALRNLRGIGGITIDEYDCKFPPANTNQ